MPFIIVVVLPMFPDNGAASSAPVKAIMTQYVMFIVFCFYFFVSLCLLFVWCLLTVPLVNAKPWNFWKRC